MDIYGYYETDANHNQARFSRRCFFPTDSHCKIIGYPIAWDIDLRVLGRIIDYGKVCSVYISCKTELNLLIFVHCNIWSKVDNKGKGGTSKHGHVTPLGSEEDYKKSKGLSLSLGPKHCLKSYYR